MCECLKHELNKRLSEQNKQYKFVTFNDCAKDLSPNLSRIYELAKQWCGKFPNSQILNINMIGGTGTGKTFLLECMASELIARGFNVMFTTAFALNDECRKYHFSLPSKVNEFMDCDVLIIDDLGTEPMLKNVTCEYMQLVLDERVRDGKATIITTNLSELQLKEKYGERIFSRLSDTKHSLMRRIPGKDLRLK